LRGHTTQTPETTEMAQVTKDASDYQVLSKKNKKMIIWIFGWVMADMRKKGVFSGFVEFYKLFLVRSLAKIANGLISHTAK
jgi:hypothetical protein